MRLPSTTERKKQSILFAEDDRYLRLLYKQFMGKYLPDCKIITATNGATAWKLMKRLKVEVVITDINMPEVDGRSLFRLANNRYSSSMNYHMPRFIFCSGVLASLNIVSTSLASHKVLVMEKPFHLSNLAKVISSILPEPEASSGP